MRENRPGLLIIAVLALAAGYLLQRQLAKAAARPASQTRIDFALPDLDGRARRLSDWAGKIVVVNFWATWCPPCRAELPDFVRIQQQYAPRGVQFIGIAVDDAAAVREFLKAEPLNYPVLMDASEGQMSAQFGNGDGAIPYTFIVDRQGKLVSTRRGQFYTVELQDTLNELVAH